MTANTPAGPMDAAAHLAKLDALAGDLNDPKLAECVHRLSGLMQATRALLSDLPRAVEDRPSFLRELPPQRAAD